MLTTRPPAHAVARWPALAAPSAAELRRKQVKILSIGGGVSALLAAAGAIAWYFTSNVDYLITGTSFAVLVGGTAVGGVVVARKMHADNR